MSLINSLSKVPFVGNLVKTSYVIVSEVSVFSRVVDCYSVRLSGNAFGCNALIVTNKELFEAHTRFTTYVDDINIKPEDIVPGKIYDVCLTSTNRNRKKSPGKLVWFHSSPYSGDDITSKAGFIFNVSDLEEIVNRTKRLFDKTVKRPTVWQKVKTKTCMLFKNFPKEA